MEQETLRMQDQIDSLAQQIAERLLATLPAFKAAELYDKQFEPEKSDIDKIEGVIQCLGFLDSYLDFGLEGFASSHEKVDKLLNAIDVLIDSLSESFQPFNLRDLEYLVAIRLFFEVEESFADLPDKTQDASRDEYVSSRREGFAMIRDGREENAGRWRSLLGLCETLLSDATATPHSWLASVTNEFPNLMNGTQRWRAAWEQSQDASFAARSHSPAINQPYLQGSQPKVAVSTH